MSKRIPYLDFLRILAIFFVIILHTEIPFLTDVSLYGSRSWYLCIFQNEFNRIGVPLFFMISGYLLLSADSTLDISKFYRKRFGKLLPPLLVWNLIYAVYYAAQAGAPFQFVEFLKRLINNGNAYHMWFIYTLLGIYLIAPFLKRIIDASNFRQQLLLIFIILFPCTICPFINTVTPAYFHLFDPLMEGYIGYFLLGYLLGTHTFSLKSRFLIYLGGITGLFIGILENTFTSSAVACPLPFNMGYSVNHYLCATAMFVLVRSIFYRNQSRLCKFEKLLARTSDLIFGVYWVHVLILNQLVKLVAGRLSVAASLASESLLTILLSLLFAFVVSNIPVLRKALM